MDFNRLFSSRSREVRPSGIRRVFDLGAKMTEKIDLSIGQPHFPVPQPIKQAAITAINENRNAYTPTQGAIALRAKIEAALCGELGVQWHVDTRPTSDADMSRPGLLVTSGTSGAIMLALLSLIGPGDEMIVGDPYFLMYKPAAAMFGGTAVAVDTYPDFQLTAERVEKAITPRTKIVLLNSPSNPAGTVTSARECKALLDLCRAKGILLISDEIYDEFTYSDACVETPIGPRCPSPARFAGSPEQVLIVRGFGKTYGVTGWRLGYAVGPRTLIEEMAKYQQYSFVCAPSALQHGVAAAFDVDMREYVAGYQKNRDMVVERLSKVTELTTPQGAFYAFPKVPEKLGLTGGAFFEKCIEHKLLVVPGKEFSSRDTHIRLSYATDPNTLERGLDVLVKLMR